MKTFNKLGLCGIVIGDGAGQSWVNSAVMENTGYVTAQPVTDMKQVLGIARPVRESQKDDIRK